MYIRDHVGHCVMGDMLKYDVFEVNDIKSLYRKKILSDDGLRPVLLKLYFIMSIYLTISNTIS